MRNTSTVLRSLFFLIVSTGAGCDNVEWGGSDIQLVPSPPPQREVAPDAQTTTRLGLPSNPVLFHVIRTGGTGRVIPIAEVSGDSLRTLQRPAEVSPEAYESQFRRTVLEPGAQLVLFRRGAQVGTMGVQGAGPVTRCGLPTATGVLNTVAAAADAPEFIAFRQGLAPQVRGEYSPPQLSGPIQRYAHLIAERIVLQNGLPRPRSWQGAQEDLQSVELTGGGNPEMAATYLVGDTLGVGPAEPDGYSIFYIADYESRRGYTPVYTAVARYNQGGKTAPRAVDYLDWNGDGRLEVLLQLFGQDQASYQVLGPGRNNGWSSRWQGRRC